jgi:class 3 adenylate cyclase
VEDGYPGISSRPESAYRDPLTTHVTLIGDRLTLAARLGGASRPVRVAVCDDVRELCPGDQTVFELSRNLATTGSSARD